jgi:hypothetical protein
MEAAGLLGLCALIWLIFSRQLTSAQIILLSIVFLEYLFVKFCASWSWYPKKIKSLGITIHFEKAMVPTSYLLAIMTWSFFFARGYAILIAALIILIIIVHVNVILLALHRKDRDETPPNYFSMTHKS